MKFNGSEKQNKWAAEILGNAHLTDVQTDSLLRWVGPTLYAQEIMDVKIVIDNRNNLPAYADDLGRFYKLSSADKKKVALNACDAVFDRPAAEHVRKR